MARAGSMNIPGPFNFNKSRTSLCGRVSKTQPAWGSTRATCQFIVGAWQKSDAPALQAGSKRERYPPSSTILRLEPEHARVPSEGGLFIIWVLYCGKLDQSTERRLISFFRWVRLPLPLPIFQGSDPAARL